MLGARWAIRNIALPACSSRSSSRHIHQRQRLMSKPNTTHSERTSTVFRSPDVYQVVLASIHLVNPAVRTYVLASESPIHFLPGQWLDVYVPGLSKPGGYTITSAPRLALVESAISTTQHVQEDLARGKFEVHLAIQSAMGNPVTEFLWKDPMALIGTKMQIRVGGNFTWPPAVQKPTKVVFVAGGVGINPLMSMISHIYSLSDEEKPSSVEVLYSFKVPPPGQTSTLESGKQLFGTDEVLFLAELLEMKQNWSSHKSVTMGLQLFLTGDAASADVDDGFPKDIEKRRLADEDVRDVLGLAESKAKGSVVGYVCGPPQMTDQLVQTMKDAGLDESNVLCEKWW
jgi:NAD(P)H-flavin reductase